MKLVVLHKVWGSKAEFFLEVLEGLGNSNRLLGTISTSAGTPPILW